MKLPKLLQAVLVLVAIYFGFILLFDVVLDAVIPSSLLNMYMFFVAAGVFMVFTFRAEGAAELITPIKALAADPDKKALRWVVLIVLPVLVAGYVYARMLPRIEAPVELRTIHPAPPASFKAYGKRFDIRTLENPFRKFESEDPTRFQELVAEGGRIYIENCHYCHGDKLDGNGPYAAALNPVPLNFQDVGTIAQLQESYLFWRIATGGPGLPKEATPWLSSMPVWQEFLSEVQIWKVILYLYDYTGHSPRVWQEQ